MHIRFLPLEVSSQIAAGEIIHQPSSVVKELIENSLDANAKIIKVHIYQGGIKKIVVYDNGKGIHKNDLLLSIHKYATSKIFTLHDLKNLKTLGFRGEALSSINAISKIKLTSKTKFQKLGWGIYKKKGDQFQIFPVSHPTGTTVEVSDLFYNFPVRRQFIKNENIEFNYIHNVIKEIALSRFDIEIQIYHNGKLIHFYNSQDILNKKNRIEFVMGKKIFLQLITVKNKKDKHRISGWITNPINNLNSYSKKYLYINGRIVKNYLLNHAVSQVYRLFNTLRNFSYVLYFFIDPKEININIHPTKRDVSFYQPKKVFDFVYQSIFDLFQKEKNKHFIKIKKNRKKKLLEKKEYSTQCTGNKKPILFKKVLTIIKNKYALIKNYRNDIYLISIFMLYNIVQKYDFDNKNDKKKGKLLLFPLRTVIKKKEKSIIDNFLYRFESIGLYLEIENTDLVLFKIAEVYCQCNLLDLILNLINFVKKKNQISFDEIKIWIINYLIVQKKQWNSQEIIVLLWKLEKIYPSITSSSLSSLIQKINLTKLFNQLEYQF